MKNKRKARPSTQDGFSMIELVVVVGIILLLSAISVPNIMRSMNIYRLNATATSLQNIIEVARFNAVRRNTSISVRQAVVSGQPAYYVDLANGAYVSTDPVFLVPNYVQVTPTGAPAASTTGLPNTNALGSGCITFNSRGVVDYTTCGGGVQSVWYISLGATSTSAGYRAITVTPMGQAKVWSATGSGGWSAM